MASKMIFTLVAALLVASAAANKAPALPQADIAKITIICSTDTNVASSTTGCSTVSAGPVTTVAAKCPTNYQAIGGFCAFGPSTTPFGQGLVPTLTNLTVPGGAPTPVPTTITTQSCVALGVISSAGGVANLASQVWCQKVTTSTSKGL